MSDYNAGNIKVLKGLEPVQKRPGMYTDTRNPNHIIEEVIDNSADEALAGFATKIVVTKLKDGKFKVEDNGRGIPVDIHPEKKIPAVEVIFTSLHAGGKFEKDDGSGAYSFAGGLHGVGVTVTNALSKLIEIEVKKGGSLYSMSFENGTVKNKLKKIGKIDKSDTGTSVLVDPDEKYFDSNEVDLKELKETLKAKAVLLSGIDIKLIIEKENKEDEIVEWYYPNGVNDYMEELIKDKDAITPIFSGSNYIDEDNDDFSKGEGVEWSVVWTSDSSHKESFVNLIPTPLGGTHESGFRNGVFIAVKNFAEQYEMIPRGLKISSEDVAGKMCYILSAKILDPQFQGQTKDKLNNRDSVKLVNGLVGHHFELWLNENKEIGKIIAEQTIRQAQARNKKSNKDIIKKKSGVTFLPGKLTDCSSSIFEEREVFIVEGDSAGGSAKQGRDKERQAILALRGKPLNTWEIGSDDILTNLEIADIKAAIGVEPHSVNDDNVDLSKMRYNRICILSDADKDGHHIQVLLLALFLKHFPMLVVNGHVYISQPPLYRVDVKYPNKKKKKEEKFYLLDNKELEELKKRMEKENVPEANVKMTRFKGLGEMNPEQLYETTLSPDTRRLLPVLIEEDKMEETLKMLDMLLCQKKSGERKEWVSEKGDLLTEDLE